MTVPNFPGTASHRSPNHPRCFRGHEEQQPHRPKNAAQKTPRTRSNLPNTLPPFARPAFGRAKPRVRARGAPDPRNSTITSDKSSTKHPRHQPPRQKLRQIQTAIATSLHPLNRTPNPTTNCELQRQRDPAAVTTSPSQEARRVVPNYFEGTSLWYVSAPR